MIDALYQKDILRLAGHAKGAGKLAGPDARAMRDNPYCGDRVTMEVIVENDTIRELAHEVKACVLCQAAASAIGACAPGKSRQELADVYQALEAMLQSGATPPAGEWAQLAVFEPVIAQKSRHDCVLLPFEALNEALDKACGGKRDEAG